MKQAVNLLEDKILYALSALALPIMATSLIQMAYNLTDMIWIGKIGSGAVAAIGAAGMFMWFSNGLATIAKMGGQIKVAQALGAGSVEKARRYATASFQLAIGFALGFGLLTLFFGRWMIDFFRLHDPQVIKDAYIYLMMTCGLVIFSFLNQLFTGTLTAMGNSRISWYIINDSSNSHTNIPYPFYQLFIKPWLMTVKYSCKIEYVNVDLYCSLWL